ncbi:ESPR domain-containing protein, partial [Psychrobacter sp. 1Y4]|uniref:ESPR domain-containing protein n=1 Tax=Psychrobacter sp. 1Y4 TaxID=3453575 RepID=UPI003F46E3EB
MNHVYRVVFNHSLGVYQCVSELAKSRDKSSGKSQVATKLLLTPLAVALLCASGSALAVTYDNGQTTTINDDVYFVENDTVSNQGTELVVNKLILEKTEAGQPSELFINNEGTVI